MSTSAEYSDSAIAKWFAGKNIFITGATGFLGKILLEKLLRSCSNIGNIYILVRSKRNRLPEERLSKLLSVTLFDQVRNENPDAFKKIKLLEGDISLPSLGINDENKAVLTQNVHVVFHSAATIKFNDTLRRALQINVQGVQEMIKLAYEMKKLQSFVHVSSAYSNCNRYEIEEKFYPPPMELKKLAQLIDSVEDDILDEMTPKLLRGWPNTYTFTKAVAEQIYMEHINTLPVAIFRPSIVISTWREPLAGWGDNLSGPTGYFITAGKGITRSTIIRKSYIVDFIPVDIVINAMIAIAWHTGTMNKCPDFLKNVKACCDDVSNVIAKLMSTSESDAHILPWLPIQAIGWAGPNQHNNNIEIYNCATGIGNPLKMDRLEPFIRKYAIMYPQNEIFWYVDGSMKENRILHNIASFLQHKIPAYVADFAYMIMGKKPFYVKIHHQIVEMMQILEYFCLNEFRFESKNIPKLIDNLSETDRKLFDFDVRHFDWDDYFNKYFYGIKLYFLKEGPETLPAARKNMQRMKYLHYTVKTFFLVLFYKFFLHDTGLIQFIYYIILYVCNIFLKIFY